MIIKSMSRKQPSFDQLLAYIDRDDAAGEFRLRHNLLGRSREAMVREFERNATLLPKRKNGVYLYHEIISIKRASGIEAEEQRDKLRQIVDNYIEARCPDNLCYGGLHQDKDHSFHYHLAISANGAGQNRRHRLTKKQFREITTGLERYVLERFPELGQEVAIDKRRETKRSQKGEALKQRTGRLPKQEQVLGRARAALDYAQDRQDLLDRLGREDLELYARGKNLGLIDLKSGKRHRLETLAKGLQDQVEEIMQRSAEAGRQAQPQEPEKSARASRKRDKGKEPEPSKGGPEMSPAGQKEKEPVEHREKVVPSEFEQERDVQVDREPDCNETDVQKAWREQMRATRDEMSRKDDPERDR